MGPFEPLPAGVSWKSSPLFNIRLSRRELEAALGPPHARDLDSNGVGLFDAWALRFPCGLEMTICQFQNAPGGFEPLTDDAQPADVEVHANDTDFEHLRFHLPIRARDLSKWEPDGTGTGPRSWRVIRQDDNGNEFEVGAFTSPCEAEEVASSFERRGHKQLYWVQPAP